MVVAVKLHVEVVEVHVPDKRGSGCMATQASITLFCCLLHHTQLKQQQHQAVNYRVPTLQFFCLVLLCLLCNGKDNIIKDTMPCTAVLCTTLCSAVRHAVQCALHYVLFSTSYMQT